MQHFIFQPSSIPIYFSHISTFLILFPTSSKELKKCLATPIFLKSLRCLDVEIVEADVVEVVVEVDQLAVHLALHQLGGALQRRLLVLQLHFNLHSARVFKKRF